MEIKEISIEDNKQIVNNCGALKTNFYFNKQNKTKQKYFLTGKAVIFVFVIIIHWKIQTLNEEEEEDFDK